MTDLLVGLIISFIVIAGCILIEYIYKLFVFIDKKVIEYRYFKHIEDDSYLRNQKAINRIRKDLRI
jgi:hypothetical protein